MALWVDQMNSAYSVPSHASASLQRTLSSLLSVVEEENGLLSRHEFSSHGSITERKNQALRELMAVHRIHPGIAASAACQPLLVQLKSSLSKNSKLLQLSIAAVGEMSDIIIGAMREADSDGTYSRRETRLRG